MREDTCGGNPSSRVNVKVRYLITRKSALSSSDAGIEEEFQIVDPQTRSNFASTREPDAMDLTTTYLGLTLRSPLVPSASPLSEKIENVREMEQAGAAAVVFHSLFEEEIEDVAPECRVGPATYLDNARSCRPRSFRTMPHARARSSSG
jgi:hypothetical protein